MEQLTDERRDQILQGLLNAMRLVPDGMQAVAFLIHMMDKELFDMRQYVMRVEGLIRDWYDTFLMAYPRPAPPATDSPRTTDPTTSYPRSPIEHAVLDALAALGSTGASPLDLSRRLPYPRAEIATTLRALVTLGTVERYYHGAYRLQQPGSREEGPPASREELLQRLTELTPPPVSSLYEPPTPPEPELPASAPQAPPDPPEPPRS